MEGFEARSILRERAIAPLDAGPRLIGTGVHPHHDLVRQRGADLGGGDRPPAERQHGVAGFVQEPQRDLLLGGAKRPLPFPRENAGNRFAERALDLGVGVDRVGRERGGRGFGGGRLAGSHEADEHELLAHARHPIRSLYAARAARASSMWSPPNFCR